MKKILIMEQEIVVNDLVGLIRDLERKSGQQFEIFLACCPLEADMRLPFVDIAIIDISTEERHEIAHRALSAHSVPTIVTDTGFSPEEEETLEMASNQPLVRFLSKPTFNIEKFKKTILEFAPLAEEKRGRLSFAA